jgi:hypothetical protein
VKDLVVIVYPVEIMLIFQGYPRIVAMFGTTQRVLGLASKTEGLSSMIFVKVCGRVGHL